MNDERPSTPLDVEDDTGSRRYVGRLDGHDVGFTSYVVRDGRMELPHTVVPPEFGGRGYAGQIVRFALDDARSRGLTVVPSCPYVRAWIDLHPEYADLVA